MSLLNYLQNTSLADPRLWGRDVRLAEGSEAFLVKEVRQWHPGVEVTEKRGIVLPGRVGVGRKEPNGRTFHGELGGCYIGVRGIKAAARSNADKIVVMADGSRQLEDVVTMNGTKAGKDSNKWKLHN